MSQCSCFQTKNVFIAFSQNCRYIMTTYIIVYLNKKNTYIVHLYRTIIDNLQKTNIFGVSKL